jgi:hypothetical protein
LSCAHAVPGVSIWRAVGIRDNQEVVVDFLLADSEYLRSALKRNRVVAFGTLQVLILTLEDPILLKTMAGRLQDQADLPGDLVSCAFLWISRTEIQEGE